MVNIDIIKKVLLNVEDKIKTSGSDSIFKYERTKYTWPIKISDVVRDLGEKGLRTKNTEIKINEVQNQLEDIYIRSLAKCEPVKKIEDFNFIADALVNVDSEFIDYLVARNPNISEETRFKLALRQGQAPEILIELARNAKSPRLLEYLFNTESNDLKIAIVNNPVLRKSSRCEEFYLSLFSTINSDEFLKLNENVIPTSLKPEYMRKRNILYQNNDLQQLYVVIQNNTPRYRENDLFKMACEEQSINRVKYQMLLKTLYKK